MTDFEKTVIEFIGDQRECNGKQEKATENIEKNVDIIFKKLNGVNIQKLHKDVDEQGDKIQRVSGAGALAVVLIPIMLFLLRELF